MVLSPRGDVAAITRGKDVTIRATDSGALLAQFPVERMPFLGFSADGQTLYRMLHTLSSNSYPFELVRWSRRGGSSWTYRPQNAEPKMIKRICVTYAGVISIEKSEGDFDALVNLDTGVTLERLPVESIPVRQATDFAPGLGLVALGNRYVLALHLTFSVLPIRSAVSISNRHRPWAALPLCSSVRTNDSFSATRKMALFFLKRGTSPKWDGCVFPRERISAAPSFRTDPPLSSKDINARVSRLFSTTSGLESYVSTDGPVRNLAANLDGSMLVFADNAGVSVARFADSAERRHLAGHVGGVTCVEFSPDGRILASTGKDGSIRLWDVDSGSLRKAVDRPGAVGQTVSFSPDAKALAVTDYQRQEVQIVSTETGEEISSLGQPGQKGSMGASFSRDGRYLLALGGGLRVWDFTSDKKNPTQLEIAQNGQGYTADLQLDPSGQWFAFSRMSNPTSNRMIRIFVGRIDSQFSVEPIEGAQIPDRVQTIAFVPGRAQLAFTSEEAGSRELHFLDLNTKQIVRKLPLLLLSEKSNSSVFNLRFSADGTRFASISHDGRRVVVYDTDSGRRLYLLPASEGTVLWIAWHPNGKQLALAQDDGDISLWNLPAVEKVLVDAGLVR